jgi:hypothetical protein
VCGGVWGCVGGVGCVCGGGGGVSGVGVWGHPLRSNIPILFNSNFSFSWKLNLAPNIQKYLKKGAHIK